MQGVKQKVLLKRCDEEQKQKNGDLAENLNNNVRKKTETKKEPRKLILTLKEPRMRRREHRWKERMKK